jgi:hypothetical protein
MFLFENLQWYSVIMWFVVLGGLILANEIARINKWFSLAMFVALPLVLTIFVWPRTAGEGSSTGTWFHWVKVYSALAGCIGFLAIRHIKGLSSNKYALMFPPAILALNILEACVRDFEVWRMNAQGMVDGVYMYSGPWNVMNAVAGILNIVTICGWMGIFISKDKRKDMLWPDMLWIWIIPYDIWNFAYVYNCVGDHSFYAGAALLLSCTIPAFCMRKGAWLQHRAQTLAIWMMFTMAVPSFVSSSAFAVKSSHSYAALFTISALALASNLALFIYQSWVVVTKKRNPLKQELFTHLASYRRVAAER